MQLSERIAQLALTTFEKLPRRCKPLVQADSQRQWTPLSAIIIGLEDSDDTILKCVSLATGTKCLPASQIRRCHGLVLHDCHAEVLALRGLNYWLLREVKLAIEKPAYISDIVEICNKDTAGSNLDPECRPFQLRGCVAIYMFTTVAPCGDASMDLLISSSADATPWSSSTLGNDPRTAPPLGRGYFSLLGAVRRKPARGDAEATLSKSCTDKMTLKQFTGVLAFPTDLFLKTNQQTFLKGLVVYKDQYDSVGFERAFGRTGRLKTTTCNAGWHFDFHVLPQDFPRFDFERIAGDQKQKVANTSAVYICDSVDTPPIQEVLVNGVKQGYKQFEDRPGKGSVLCRRKMFELGREVARLLGTQLSSDDGAEHELYNDFKTLLLRSYRRGIKENFTQQLGGWISNSSEDNFSSEKAGGISTGV